MTISIELTDLAKKVVAERLKHSKEDQIAVITEFERFTWCSTHRARWTSVHFEDKDTSRMDELELLGTTNDLQIYVDQEAAYFLIMVRKIVLDGKMEGERSYLIIADIE